MERMSEDFSMYIMMIWYNVKLQKFSKPVELVFNDFNSIIIMKS